MTCGIDLLKVTFKEGYSGFNDFLSQYGSKISSISDLGGYNKKISFNFNGIGYDAIVSTGKKTIGIMVGALREYKHDSRSERRWKFLQMLYKHYPKLRITELHFAIDIPYWFNDLQVGPSNYIYRSMKSTIYFDARRARLKSNEKLKSKDNIVIYDKSWKCGLAIPLSRIELRADSSYLGNIANGLVADTAVQQELLRKIDKKFRTLKIKKGRGTVRIDACNKSKPLAVAMQYLEGDDSLLPLLLEHRIQETTDSSRLFNRFLAIYCSLANPRKKLIGHRDIRLLHDELSAKEKSDFKLMLNNIKNYDKDSLCKNIRKSKRRLLELDKRLIEEMSFTGMAMADIAEEFGVSESTVSRVLKYRGIRRVRLKNTVYMMW